MKTPDRPKRGQAENALQETVRLLREFEATNYDVNSGETVSYEMLADGSGHLVAHTYEDFGNAEMPGRRSTGIFSFDSAEELRSFLKASPGRRLLMLGSDCGIPF